MRTLAEWLALQESVHARSVDLGLERVSAVARKLAIDKPTYRVITVAGTNGKGSTVAYLDAIFRASGLRTGAFTSPHLVRYNERITVDGVEASDAALIAAFERIDAARGSTTLTFFEFNALAALLVFEDSRVDVAVLEVGLGGRLDAANIVDADVGIVCSIGFDHRDWLGDTLDLIGEEKAGIFRPNRPAVLGTRDVPRSVYRAIETIQAQPVVAERDFTWTVEGNTWSYKGTHTELRDLPLPALAGRIQLRNAATALAAIEALGVPPMLDQQAVSTALSTVKLAGQFQVVPGEVDWIFDVAHNEPAAQVLAQNLRSHPVKGKTVAVTGILQDKDARAIGRALEGVIDRWVLCTLPGARGSSAADLATRLNLRTQTAKGFVAQSDSVEAGCTLARELAQPGDRVVVFGSFVTVGSAMQSLGYTGATTSGP